MEVAVAVANSRLKTDAARSSESEKTSFLGSVPGVANSMLSGSAGRATWRLSKFSDSSGQRYRHGDSLRYPSSAELAEPSMVSSNSPVSFPFKWAMTSRSVHAGWSIASCSRTLILTVSWAPPRRVFSPHGNPFRTHVPHMSSTCSNSHCRSGTEIWEKRLTPRRAVRQASHLGLPFEP